jgi:WD40 repeat protein
MPLSLSHLRQSSQGRYTRHSIVRSPHKPPSAINPKKPVSMSQSSSLPRSHDADIVDIRFNSSGNYLASCALDGTLRVYSMSRNCFAHTFEFTRTPSCMSWVDTIPGNLSLVVGFSNGELFQVMFQRGNVCFPTFTFLFGLFNYHYPAGFKLSTSGRSQR